MSINIIKKQNEPIKLGDLHDCSYFLILSDIENDVFDYIHKKYDDTDDTSFVIMISGNTIDLISMNNDTIVIPIDVIGLEINTTAILR